MNQEPVQAVPSPPVAERPRVRATLRVDTPSGPVAQKSHRANPQWFVRWLVRLGWKEAPAAREHAIALHLHRRGVAVPEPLTLVRDDESGADLVTSRWIEGARDLESVWRDPALAPRRRRELAGALGRLVRALHEAGVVHRDLHPRNVLVPGESGAALLLVDFHRARWSASGRARARDLVDLGHFFLARSRVVDRLRFLHEWATPRWPAERAARHARLRELGARALDSRHAFFLHHEKRCDGRGRAFTRLRFGAWRGVGRREWSERILAALGGDPLATVRSRGRRLHAGGDAELWRLELDGCPFPLAVKTFDDRGLWKRLLRGSRAARAWKNFFRFEMSELSIPQPLLFLELRTLAPHSPRPSSLLITEFLDDHEMLHRHVERVGAAARPQLERLARALARLHDEGLTHRDLKAENLLVGPGGATIRFVDPDGVDRVRSVSAERAARDLMRLNASFRDFKTVTWRDRLRFLAAYRAARRIERPKFRPLWRTIAKLTQNKWQSQDNAAH